MPEIDATQLAQLREVASTVEKLWAKPESRKLLQEALKLQNPDLAIPELEAKREVMQQLEEERKARKELEEEFKKDKQARELAEQRAQFSAQWEAEKSALRANGYMDEGIAKIEEHAKKHGIPSLEVAAAHWEKLNPPREVVTPSGGSWNFFGTPDDAGDQTEFMKKMMDSHGDDERALDQEIVRSLQDFRQQRPR